ncbi:solute carrier organic anion transporter family member 1C1-like [Sinocyclocheilus anshuiensis]|uniref:solute carrier organic anion transporter family member 1C1-like n=1 Tax=Sinocyclocheilus anshuiensis TaxID=1608454 RepID=UPI0007BA805F|nr:PREDICTED: solute carrier organic anion transporter family member 1C1-like [Sinocyclocheilus anshuiensis]
MGNLLVITVVSYFGSKFHRPKIIGVLLMGVGTLLMALPHFIMSQYKYDTAAAHSNDADNFTVSSTCSSDNQSTVQQLVSGCLKEEAESSPTWVIVLFGNILRGIKLLLLLLFILFFYHIKATHVSRDLVYFVIFFFSVGCLHTLGVIGPFFGYSLGSLCASFYVDIGLVNQESVTITPQDSRWVGAWWLGYVVSGLLTLLAALPLWFLPRALPENPQTSKLDHPSNQHKHTLSITEIAKDFGPSLKRLLTNGIYLLYLVYGVLAFNAFTIVITYTPKYLEQQFGQSASKTNFLIGVTSIPSVALGMFLSGWIMKRFKLSLLGSTRLMFFCSVTSLVCTIPYFALSCENIDVAGVTVPYQGSIEVQDISRGLLTSCNTDCGCPDFQWDPVCGQNEVTYISPCHAGCNSTRGAEQNMTFHGCTCIQSWGLTSGNSSAVLGQCSRETSCTKMFYIYLALQSLAFFVYCLGTVPFFLVSLRIVDPALKSLSVGVFLLVLRIFGGIPAPICFGALIDSTCLKWGQKKCGGSGTCRMYDIETFRYLFLGLVSSLRTISYTLLWIVTIQIKRKVQNDKQMSKDAELQHPIFIGVFAFCYFYKLLTRSYTKSTITQIESHFEIQSSSAGIINGSFEMGTSTIQLPPTLMMLIISQTTSLTTTNLASKAATQLRLLYSQLLKP